MVQTSSVSRRAFLQSSIGVAAAWELEHAARALGLPEGTPVCNTSMAEQEVGPYYVASELVRRNVREGKPGLPLLLKLTVLDARTCKPLQNSAIDLWHCDALGLYAGFTKMNPAGVDPGGPPPGSDPNDFGPPPGFDPQHPHNRPGPRRAWCRRRPCTPPTR